MNHIDEIMEKADSLSVMQLSILASRISRLHMEKEHKQKAEQRNGEYTCTLDADGWELYSETKGVEAAAKSLSNALTKEVRKVKEMEGADYVYHAKQIRERMYKLMNKYAKFGARDTEPESVLCEQLRKAFGLEDYEFNRWE